MTVTGLTLSEGAAQFTSAQVELDMPSVEKVPAKTVSKATQRPPKKLFVWERQHSVPRRVPKKRRPGEGQIRRAPVFSYIFGTR